MLKQGLILQIYSYLTNNSDKDKKAKSTKKDVIKRKLKFKDCKHCLEIKEKNIVDELM